MSPIRVLIAKPGLDGHDRGAKVIARALRDGGVDVVYTGLHQSAEQIVDMAIAENTDAIGMSVLSGSHLTTFPAVIDLLKERGASNIVVFGGGVIPKDDIAELKAAGAAQIFTSGTPISDVVEWVRSNVSSSIAR